LDNIPQKTITPKGEKDISKEDLHGKRKQRKLKKHLDLKKLIDRVG
jgi:hypothetical protein